MTHLLVALLIACVMTPAAHADTVDYNAAASEAELYYVKPNPRPAPYPGNPPRRPPGPVRPTPPRNPPPPPHRPAPPPAYRYDYVTCSSYNYRYTECYFNSYGVSQVRLYRQNSYDSCIWGSTAGVYGDRLWVDRGCSATFEIIRYY